MGIDLPTLGAKVRKYREQLAESITDLVKATGIATERIEGIEAGTVEPTGDEVLILADHFRCDFRFFVSNERTAPFEQVDALYRAHGDDFSKSDRRAVQDFLYLCETEAHLMTELSVPCGSFEHRPSGQNPRSHAEPGARALLAHLGYRNGEAPVDVYADMRTAGVHVFRRKLGNSAISGLFIKHPTAGKCALVNLSEDVYRQRFSAAHEMAHAIFDTDQEASVSYAGNPGEDPRETRANRFASCFLMPDEFLRTLPDPNGWNEVQTMYWANRIKVSCNALGFALKRARLIDERKLTSIRHLRVPREEKSDPELPSSLNPVQRERKTALLESGLSDFYVSLCFDAASQGVISAGRLAEALFCGQADLPELAALYGRRPFGH